MSLGKILHIANSYPSSTDRELFYEIKSRILRQRGTTDGYDLQHIPGKKCFSCDGTGIYVGYHTFSGTRFEDYCRRCGESGWHKRPKWIVLDRWILDGFVFHIPGQVHRIEPDSGTARKQITGVIEHRNYSYRQICRAHLLLGLRCDRRLARLAAKEIWHCSRIYGLWRQYARECQHCHRRTWRKDWTCRRCERQRTPQDVVPSRPIKPNR